MTIKSWIIFIIILVLSLIITNISPFMRIFHLTEDLYQVNTFSMRKDMKLHSYNYSTQDQFAASFNTIPVPRNYSVRQSEDDINNLARRAKWDLKSVYSGINEKRYSSLALEIGM